MRAADDTITVLHVDDEPGLGDLVATCLKREDERLTVHTAPSAADGLAVLDERAVDCVVSDYDMPGQNGIEFLRAVRESHPDLPFVLYTGKGSEEVAAEAISAGVTDYLQKEQGTDQYAVLANRIVNVVESYRSRQELAERNRSLRRYKHMVNSMDDAACVYDADGRFVIVNEYLADWYDTTREALVGEKSELIPAIRAQADDGDPYGALLDGRRDHVEGEIAAEFPGHGRAVLEYRLTPLVADGTIEGVVGVARDVTERKAREREFHRTKRAMDEAPVGITITDPDREDNPIIYANPRFRELTGYEESELLGRNCRFLQGPDTTDEPVTEMRRAIDAEETVTVELRNYRKDGTEFWNQVHVAPVRIDGEVTNYVGFQQDVTERTERERELERQNDRLDQFSSIVSHDLRNPLNVAQGQLALAREDRDDEHLEAVARAHERMESLISDLLTLARSGDPVTDLTPVDLAAVTADCWATVDTADATLETDAEGTVLADEGRLKQVLENLVRNAVNHGATGSRPRADDAGDHGVVGVTVTVGTLDDGFYVEDDGPGVPPEDRDAVFDAGYTTTDQGTGFGLHIVDQVAEAHGWTVNLTDGTDGGARFEVTGVEVLEE